MVRDRVFAASLGVSTLLHLSMVTVFRIVILFEAEDIEYYPIEIIEESLMRGLRLSAPNSMAGLDGSGDAADATLLEPDADRSLTLEGRDDFWGSLPEIQLPTLRFAELDRLRLREEGLTLQSRFKSMLGLETRDSWSRFGEELGQIGSALSRLALGGPAVLEEETPEPVGRPAVGFETYIEWMSEPKDRQLNFAPPIKALWSLDPSELEEPLVFVFKVNPQGKVIEVLNPVVDEAGVTTSAARALAKYRFEPLEDANAGNQHGTLLISPARRGP